MDARRAANIRLFDTRIAASLILAVVIAPFAVAQAADKIDGETAFNNACRTCHSVKEGDNRLGPNLHGIVGRKAGAAEGFAYSPVMDGSFSWDEAKLDGFIANPEKAVPGNAMKPYAGIDDAATRKAIIDFLKGS